MLTKRASSERLVSEPLRNQPVPLQNIHDPQSSPLLHVLASGTAGAVSRFATHPMDTVRTRMQIDRGSGLSQQSVWRVGSSIYKHEGLRGLYSGVTLAMAVSAPALSVFLTTYDLVKSRLRTRGYSPDSLGVHVISGTCAEIVSGALWTPMEVVKQKLQAQSGDMGSRVYRGGLQGTRFVLATEGIRGLYRGYFLTLSVYIPQTITFFVLYERLKLFAKGHNGTGKLGFSDYFVCSCLASVVAAGATCPFDLVKTRWQVQRGDMASQGKAWLGLNYKSPWHAVIDIYKEEGVRGFFKGVGARILWVAPSIAVSMTCYEAFKRWSAKRAKRRAARLI